MVRLNIAALLLALPLQAALTVAVTGVTQTQAVVAIAGQTGACTLELSESATYSPLVPDVDASKHSGSSTDTGRADTVTWADGSRHVTLGHMIGDRGLASHVLHYLRVSSCGGTVTTTFLPSTIALGTTYPVPPPFDNTKWGNRGWPVDLTNLTSHAKRVDPLTGAEMFLSSTPLDFTAHINVQAFDIWDGGSGWTNPSSILTGASSTAVTSGTNPVDLYIARDDTFLLPYSVDWRWNDIGVVINGCGDDPSPDNRVIKVGLFKNATTGTIGTPFDVPLPLCTSGLPAVPSASTDADAPWPDSVPSAFYGGWGTGVFLAEEDKSTIGTLAASSGTVTIDGNPSKTSHISSAIEVGNKLWVSGSSCTNNVCTYDAVPTSALVGHVSTSITASSGTAYASLRGGVRVQKAPGTTGNVHVGVRYKLFGGIYPVVASASNVTCNVNAVTTGDSPAKTGHICMVGTARGAHLWYFYADDGTSRPLWAGKMPAGSYFTGLSWDAADIPNGTCCNASGSPFPDSSDGRKWWFFMPNASGVLTVYTATYSGDFTESRDFAYSMYADTSNSVLHAPSDNWDWTVVTPAASSLSTQIASLYPSYDSALYGNNWGFQGISGTSLIFGNLYSAIDQVSSGQDLPGWLAIMDSTAPATLVNLIHSMDGTGTNGLVHHGGIHNITVASVPADTSKTTMHLLDAADTRRIHGGPFRAPITAVMRSGSWDTDTALHWPASSAYDRACPIGNPFEILTGATGNNCATLRMPTGGWCNTSPHIKISPGFGTFTGTGTGLAFFGGPGTDQAATHTYTVAIDGAGTFKWKVDSGSYTTGVAMTGGWVPQALANGVNIRFLGTDPLVYIVGDQWIATAVPVEHATWPCPIPASSISGWAAADYAQPFPMKVGDVFYGVGENGGHHTGDWENMRVVAIDPTIEPDGQARVSVQRNAMVDYCSIGFPTSAQASYQLEHDTGWVAEVLPNGLNGCNGDLWMIIGKTEGTATVQDITISLTGHSDLIPGTTAGNYTNVNSGAAAQQGNIATIFTLANPINHFVTPTFDTENLPIGGGVVQSYAHAPGTVPWFVDSNTMNTNGGDSPEPWSPVSARTLTATATANVYKITVVGTLDLKKYPLYGYAGRYILQDVSGPGSDVTAAPFTMCGVVAANECITGSSADEVYVNVPSATDSGNCYIGQHFANVPCVISGWPGVGGFRQEDWTVADPAGVRSRFLTYLFGAPGTAYGYSTMTAVSPSILWGPPMMTAGWGPLGWLVKSPSFTEDAIVRNNFISTPITVTAAGGSTKARVKFGTTPSGHCRARNEACVTDNSAALFKWASESQTYLACAPSCVINVPLLANTVNYITPELLDNSGVAVGSALDTIVMTIGAVEEPAATTSGSPRRGAVRACGQCR